MEMGGLFFLPGFRHIQVPAKETALALGAARKAQHGPGPRSPHPVLVRHAGGCLITCHVSGRIVWL